MLRDNQVRIVSSSINSTLAIASQLIPSSRSTSGATHETMGGRPVAGQLDQVLPRFAVKEARPDHPIGRIPLGPFGKGVVRILGESGYIIENDGFAQNLMHWLGRPVTIDRLNETGRVPIEFRSPLHMQLTAEAHELLAARSRLDLRLWTDVAATRLGNCDISGLRERTLIVNAARYGVLMAP